MADVGFVANPLTNARNAIWNSIKNYDHATYGTKNAGRPTGTIFNGLLEFNRPGFQPETDEPCYADLPALALVPVQTVPEWFTQQEQLWPLVFRLKVYSRDWHLPAAESLIWRVGKALFSSVHPGGSFSYIKAPPTADPPGIGRHPSLGPIASGLTLLSTGEPVTVADFQIVLPINSNLYN